MNILLVEDDEVDVMSIKRVFTKNKINDNLFIAGDGEQALKMLRAADHDSPHVDQPRIILLDLKMPRMSGIEFLTELRNDPDPELSRTPVIVLTHSDLDTDRKAVNRLGVSGYFVKKRDLDEFAHTLSEFLSGVN